jgi:CheY-like chemotaxis protein
LKPVTQRDLTECLILVLANTAQSWHLQSQPMITRHALRAKRAQSGNRILLAEDNPVNQKVAARLLEKLDYRVEVVVDGRAAVAAWQTGAFDLILMDCQMPEMDGYAATREIRRLEAGQRHIPIVALTAHAMRGDEEKCRAAGMDDYLTKPIDRIKLDACLNRLLPSTGSTGLMPAMREPPAQGQAAVDWQALLQSIDGDTGFARDLLAAYIATADRELAMIAAALGREDMPAMRESAHSLKSASANLRAAAAAFVAAQLETAADLGESTGIPALVEKLTTEVRAAIQSLESRVNEQPAAGSP